MDRHARITRLIAVTPPWARIDPDNIRKIDRTAEELNVLAIFTQFVQQRKSDTIAKQIHKFFEEHPGDDPLAIVNHLLTTGQIEAVLKRDFPGLGQWTRRARFLRDLVEKGKNLGTMTPSDLKEIYGFGPKTVNLSNIAVIPPVTKVDLDHAIGEDVGSPIGAGLLGKPLTLPPLKRCGILSSTRTALVSRV